MHYTCTVSLCNIAFMGCGGGGGIVPHTEIYGRSRKAFKAHEDCDYTTCINHDYELTLCIIIVVVVMVELWAFLSSRWLLLLTLAVIGSAWHHVRVHRVGEQNRLLFPFPRETAFWPLACLLRHSYGNAVAYQKEILLSAHHDLQQDVHHFLPSRKTWRLVAVGGVRDIGGISWTQLEG